MRRFLAVAALLLAAAAAFYFWPRANRPAEAASITSRPSSDPRSNSRPPAVPPPPGADAVRAPTPAGAGAPSRGPAAFNEADFPLAARLNAPNSTIAGDLDVLRQIFETWVSNFPHEGNPVGENAEITAALTGENRLELVLVPKGHRAINSQGELCDRWQTPFRFHQLSGTKMEIRSAGPDRKFGTEDDAIWTPQ